MWPRERAVDSETYIPWLRCLGWFRRKVDLKFRRWKRWGRNFYWAISSQEDKFDASKQTNRRTEKQINKANTQTNRSLPSYNTDQHIFIQAKTCNTIQTYKARHLLTYIQTHNSLYLQTNNDKNKQNLNRTSQNVWKQEDQRSNQTQNKRKSTTTIQWTSKQTFKNTGTQTNTQNKNILSISQVNVSPSWTRSMNTSAVLLDWHGKLKNKACSKWNG